MKLFILAAALIVATSANLGAFEKWTSFKATHNKSYNVIEDKLRFAVFQDNLKKIEEHNAKYESGEETYYLAVNKFADWSSAEFQAMLARQMANKPKQSFIAKHVADPNVQAVEEVDWRDSAVLGVKDQGQCGSCWAFSTTGSLEGQLAIHKNQRVPLSEQELVDCDTSRNAGCNGGLMTDAFNYVKRHGLSSESQYAYTGRDDRCKNVENKPLSSISGYVELETTEDALASAVASVGPVSIAVDADTWQLYGGGLFNNKNCRTNLNHGVLAVGYTKDAFIVKNSWGTSWGEQGYIRVARGENLCGINLMNSYPKL
ncbi:cathepsin L-like proteinase isoform X1 [Diabrotica virgifera virgifera]|uniref:Cathepsin L-like proteinase n=1 Tax=Diabrotica virgifera virgifera TaxID=50390 RepID=Q70EX2_DIAVI|nr:cathepsin L-like proteinase isoform X1 [Diabrotica virgifera virgifera]CAE47497.1 cathepsin L-like proteinase [Diabrotica virgifera virgifera]